MTKTNEFDVKAQDWDSSQKHIDRSVAIAKAMIDAIPLERSLKAMEFGAGTALLSFELKDRLKDITLMDSSTEMVRVMQEKIETEKSNKMHPVLIDLEHQHYSGWFDLIYSQMVFHHLENVAVVLKKLSMMLRSNGYLAIADLYPEDGSFHGHGFTGHKGFDPQQLSTLLRSNGLIKVQYKQCYTIHKVVDGDKQKAFPVFLMTAVKQ